MLLVGAVAIAILGPPAVPLGQVVLMVDHDLMDATRRFVGSHLTMWLWDGLVVPVMMRPAWMVPAALGLLCGGVSLSLSTRKSAQRSHRRS